MAQIKEQYSPFLSLPFTVSQCPFPCELQYPESGGQTQLWAWELKDNLLLQGCLAAPHCSLWSVTVLTTCSSQVGAFNGNYTIIKITPSNILLYLVPSLSVYLCVCVAPEIPSKDHVYFSHWFSPRASNSAWFYCCLTQTDLGQFI